MNIIKVFVLIVFWFACVTLSLAHRHGKDSNEKDDSSASDEQQQIGSLNSIQSPKYNYFNATTETLQPQEQAPFYSNSARNYTYFDGQQWVTNEVQPQYQNSQNSQISQNNQNTQDTQNTQNNQNWQNSKISHNSHNSHNLQNSQNSQNSVQQSLWPETSINADFENRSNHIEQVNDGYRFDTSPVLDLLALNRWRTMFQRGREMMQQLPSMGLMAGGKIISDVPTPMEIFHYSKETLLGLPNDVFAYVVDSVCSAAVSMNLIQPRHEPNINAMNYLLITPENHEVVVPLRSASLLWEDPHFNRALPVVMVVTGWNSIENVTNDVIDVLYKSYRCRGDYNFVVIDTDTTVDSLYAWSAYNTKTIGKILGEALVGLRNLVGLENIHIIGHSLGANIASEAGRHFVRLSNESLPRITGLDPARPCFSEGDYPAGLRRGDARFVDIIHSNPGVMSGMDSVGDIDFFPNGHDSMQPGCTGVVCCHNRAYQYFAETVYPGKENNFMSSKCSSLRAYKMRQCVTEDTLPMGIATPAQGRGTFYLVTRRKSPFGLEQPESGVWPYRVEEKQQCKQRISYKTTGGVLE